MDFGLEFMANGGNSGDLVFLYVSLSALTEFLVYVSYHVGDFTLQQLFRPEIFMVDLVNDIKTISFLVIKTRIELSYESKELFFSALNSFAVDIVHIIELNNLNWWLFFWEHKTLAFTFEFAWLRWVHFDGWTFLGWFLLNFGWWICLKGF